MSAPAFFNYVFGMSGGLPISHMRFVPFENAFCFLLVALHGFLLSS